MNDANYWPFHNRRELEFLQSFTQFISSEDAGQKPENEKTEKKETVKEKLKDLAKDVKRAKDYYYTKSPYYPTTGRFYEEKPKPTWSPYEVRPTKWSPAMEEYRDEEEEVEKRQEWGKWGKTKN